jgi:hypothetical protein
MALQTRRRRLGAVLYQASSTQNLNIAAQFTERALHLQLTSQPTITSGNNTRANAQRGDDWGCITRFTLLDGGGNPLMRVTPIHLRKLNAYLCKFYPKLNGNLGDATTANPALTSTLILPFALRDMENPLDTALPTSLTGNLQLQTDWATFTGINSAATAFTATPNLVTFSRSHFGPHSPLAIPHIRSYVFNCPSAQTDFLCSLTTGYFIRLIQMVFVNTSGVEASGLLTSLRVSSGSTNFVDQITEAALREGSRLEHGLMDGWNTANALTTDFEYYQPYERSSSSDYFATYWIDFAEDGRISECLDTTRLNELNLFVTTSAACTIEVTTLELEALTSDQRVALYVAGNGGSNIGRNGKPITTMKTLLSA